ncbi:MAG: hypothetical protein ABR927_00225 [Bacteroidales bacterium]|jgi:hypothetical protein
MKNLLDKLNYKGQKRISVINAEETFVLSISSQLKDVIIDRKIDPRYPYQFIMIFVKSKSEVEMLAPITLHNLMVDGVLWFCYPKKTSKKYRSDIDRDHGWKALNDSGLYGIRMVAIDEDWSALRFRNKKFIKSTSDKFNK